MIPIVDCCSDIESKAKEIFEAVQSVGFVYLKNFGIDPMQMKQAFEYSQRFFSMPDDMKQKLTLGNNFQERNTGYLAPNAEKFTDESRKEYREAFNFRLRDKDYCGNLNNCLPEFYEMMRDFQTSCHKVVRLVLKALASNLSITNPDFFTPKHTLDESSISVLRLLYYPPVLDEISQDAVRCGEHSDYGTITLLFQDQAGGLEVMNRDGDFVHAKPVEGAVLVNFGDLLQRWTSDKIIAAKHRVNMPQDETLRKFCRYSIAYFAFPDDQIIVEPLDGSKKYEPISSGEYLMRKLQQTVN